MIGIGLFLYAPSLCRNAFFHYTTGVGAGVFLSLVLLTFLLQRKLNLGKWVLACYSLSVYFLTSAMYNIKTYLIQYHVYVLGYLLVSALARYGMVIKDSLVSVLNFSIEELQAFLHLSKKRG